MATLAPRPNPLHDPTAHTASFGIKSPRPRSALKRARDDSSVKEVPSSPSKRPRVQFHPDLEYASTEEDDEADPYLVHEQVRRAVNRYVVGVDEESYEKIKKIFLSDPKSDGAPSCQMVLVHLQAILSRVTSLDKRCNGLVNAVLLCEWVGRNEAFAELYIKFLGNLASAKSGFLGKILHRLVDLLGKQPTRRLPGCPVIRRPKIHSRVRQAITYLLDLVPAASSILAQVIQQNLAKDHENPRERLFYTQNFLAIVQHARELRAAVLGMITSELVKLDVSIQVDMEDYADDLSEEIVRKFSSSQAVVHPEYHLSTGGLTGKNDHVRREDEEDDGGITTDDSDDEGDILDPVERRQRNVVEHLQSVDAIMDLLFEYYHPLVLSQSLEVCDDTMNLLTTQFSNLILPTYRSRHAQFLIFHFSQTSPVFVDKFATACISTLLDHKQPSLLRQTAGSYLAGFVGRGARVPTSVISDCFRLLCDELEVLRQEFEPSCRGPNLRRYASFYSMMQAIMYIFCFRWRVLVDDSSEGEDSEDEQEIAQYRFPYDIKEKLGLALNSPLNPLRVCTPDIVGQFAETCHRLRFLYLFPKIEINRNVRLSNTRRDPSELAMGHIERNLGWAEESGMLEAYFPFDPYRLPRSRRWISGDYLEWKGLPGEDQGNEDDDADDEIMSEGGSVEDDDSASEED